MESNHEAIIDTSFLVAFFLETDSGHAQALKMFPHIIKLRKLYVTNYLFTEFATILSQRIGKKQFLNIITQLRSFQIDEIFIEKEDYNKVKLEFFDLSNKNISFVDLSTSYIAKKHNIDNVLTFDRHFNKLGKHYGFKVLGY